MRLPEGGIGEGVVVNFHRFPDVNESFSHYEALPFQKEGVGEVFYAEDILGVGPDKLPPADKPSPSEQDGQTDGGPKTEPLFWSDVEGFYEKWKLFWCETDDHDEDWFVVAHSEEEAERFHEDAEGYDYEDAKAKFVCALPATEQDHYDAAGWPENRTLLACGAEYIPYTPQDGHGELRAQAGQGGRVVRIKGDTYGEGDIVSNVLHRMGVEPAS